MCLSDQLSIFDRNVMNHLQQRMHVCLGDIHLPHADPVAVNMAVAFIKTQRPGTIHLLGDVGDYFSISRYDKDPMRRLNLQEELDAIRDWLAELRDAAPKAKIIYSEGNHEFRLRRYLRSEAKALAGLRALSLEKLLDFDKLHIRFQSQDRPYLSSKAFTGNSASAWYLFADPLRLTAIEVAFLNGHDCPTVEAGSVGGCQSRRPKDAQ